MALKFLIEQSSSSIYQRINHALVNTLLNFGHQVNYINTSEFKTDNEYLTTIKNSKIDYCLITGRSQKLFSYSQELKGFLFEFNECNNIFIHYDHLAIIPTKSLNIGSINPENFKFYLSTFLKRKHQDYHFVIEYNNFLDLRKLGINKSYLINHASEYEYIKFEQNYNYSLSFVGRLLPGISNEIFDLSHFFHADIWNRLNNFSYEIDKSAGNFAEKQLNSLQNNYLDFLTIKYFYVLGLHLSKSLEFRGELIRRIKDIPLDIIGGYSPGINNAKTKEKQFIQQDNITYHPSTTDYEQTAELYAQSQINLNITALQFDSAVINRVIDVAAVGGFILTDWRPDLLKLTTVANEISYKNLEELNHKLQYYLHNEHQQEKLDIAYTLHEDLKKTCSYSQVVETILSKITSMNSENNNHQIDLGCGKNKPKDFIGVDMYDAPEIDIVADLNQSFPFPDNYAQYIRAHDIIEHLPNRLHTMNEIWRIGKNQATVDIRVPSTDGRGAFQDPTHVSFWNINSFKYYCVEFPAYWELAKTYGFKGAFHLLSLNQEDSGEGVIHVRAILQVIKDTQAENFLNNLNLKKDNWVVFPDWEKEEELLFEDLAKVIKTLFDHPNKQDISLLIEIGNLEEETANQYLLTTIMQLAWDQVIEFNQEEDMAFNFITNINASQWEILLPHISGLISLRSPKENELHQKILAKVLMID